MKYRKLTNTLIFSWARSVIIERLKLGHRNIIQHIKLVEINLSAPALNSFVTKFCFARTKSQARRSHQFCAY